MNERILNPFYGTRVAEILRWNCEAVSKEKILNLRVRSY